MFARRVPRVRNRGQFIQERNKPRTTPVGVVMQDATHGLDDLLLGLRIRAHIAFRGLACGRWGISGPSQGRLAFHLVLRGCCWARVPGTREPIELGEGALLLYRPSGWHLLADSAETYGIVLPERVEALSHEEAGPHAGLLCGYFDGAGARSPLIDALPPYLLWRGYHAMAEPLARLAQTVRACAHDVSPSGEKMLARLCELLLHMVLREPSIVALDDVAAVRARCDPALRRTLEALHSKPGKRWTLAGLARSAGMSRSTFAQRFRDVMGTPAMTYLRQHRLALAEQRMHDGLSPTELARAMGFGSVGAFRRAKKRATLQNLPPQ
jgi:AraC-like DNA-binding protein